jgi:hypothetical protein
MTALLFIAVLLIGQDDAQADATAVPRIRLDTGHPWRPPFGLDRVGRTPRAIVEIPAEAELDGDPALSLRREGREVGRHILERPDTPPPYRFEMAVGTWVDELVLVDGTGPKTRALARLPVSLPGIEADAHATADRLINPVDLGTVLVPHGWLLLGPGQSARVEVAAFSRHTDPMLAKVNAWFESKPEVKLSTPLLLREGRRVVARLEGLTGADRDRDALVVSLTLDGVELFRKAIPVMLVRDPPMLPSFGATRLKLRFDAPISVRDPATGTFSTRGYEQGWDPALDDVVVSLPNGSRYVFWRGSSYIPFWAGRHNTGLCYEWAENLARPADAVDCVEPLMDKELRYGRVEVVESTSSRVHVRWRYQSTDLHYKVWGDEAVEDYRFYPDGFGTRVLGLKSDPAHDYELSEFIILAPQDAYPYEILPAEPIDVLGADGMTRRIALPVDRAAEELLRREVRLPALYRVRPHRDDTQAAIYFNPADPALPPLIFGPFSDQGQVVTPAYWGSHWPLARGNATGSAIDERIHATPSHNSLMSWARSKPEPIQSSTVRTLDAQGRPKTMNVRRWAWLIGMTDARDDQLRAWAASYANPPALTARGATVAFDAYAPEGRALRLAVEARDVTIEVNPTVPVVHPVFELAGTPAGTLRIALDGRPLESSRFTWDGKVLWLDTILERPSTLSLRFLEPRQTTP